MLFYQLTDTIISKLRSDKKHDYVEEHLGRRMDVFVRSYLSLKHEGTYRRAARAT